MQATLSHPVANVPDGAEDRPLVVPPNPSDVDVAASAKRAGGSSRGDCAVHQDQLEPAGEALAVQVLQPQLGGAARGLQRDQPRQVTEDLVAWLDSSCPHAPGAGEGLATLDASRPG